MTEWGVVGVIVVLLGLGAGIVGPIIKLNTSITKLTTLMDTVTGDIRELTDKNTRSHDRLWKKNEEQDEKLADHESRITVLEHTDRP